MALIKLSHLSSIKLEYRRGTGVSIWHCSSFRNRTILVSRGHDVQRLFCSRVTTISRFLYNKRIHLVLLFLPLLVY
jgi:hypothetical protein